MAQPGPLNTICDVPGILVGQAEDHTLLTGVSVVIPEAPAIAAVDHRGGGIGSRDTVALMPGSVVERAHAVCLSGGSAYGLDAGGGVMAGLRAAGRGFAVAGEIVPIVPTGIIFDLTFGGARQWEEPPWWTLGRAAFDAAGRTVREGNFGAGLGATAGPLKGGTGTASWREGGLCVGALSVANPIGSTVIPGTQTFWAWMHEQAGEMGGQVPPTGRLPAPLPTAGPGDTLANTTLAVVATNAALTREEALRVAIMAQDGIARAIRPVHSPLDGDTVFVLATGTAPAPGGPAALADLGTLAGDAVSRAIARGVYAAEALAGVPAYRGGV